MHMTSISALVETVVIPTLQMKKLRSRKTKKLTQDHTLIDVGLQFQSFLSNHSLYSTVQTHKDDPFIIKMKTDLEMGSDSVDTDPNQS